MTPPLRFDSTEIETPTNPNRALDDPTRDARRAECVRAEAERLSSGCGLGLRPYEVEIFLTEGVDRFGSMSARPEAVEAAEGLWDRAARRRGSFFFRDFLVELRLWCTLRRDEPDHYGPQHILGIGESRQIAGLLALCLDGEPRFRDADRTMHLLALLPRLDRIDRFIRILEGRLDDGLSWDRWLSVQPPLSAEPTRVHRVLRREALRIGETCKETTLPWTWFHLGVLLGCPDFSGVPVLDEAIDVLEELGVRTSRHAAYAPHARFAPAPRDWSEIARTVGRDGLGNWKSD